jgi:hypothetical protein
MKPIMQFVKDSYPDWRKVEYTDIFNMLRENGYYETKVAFNLDKRDITHRYFRFEIWCLENCPNDYIALLETFMFTNKEDAMMMKLCVE